MTNGVGVAHMPVGAGVIVGCGVIVGGGVGVLVISLIPE